MTRDLNYSTPTPLGDIGARVPALTRHLKARLEEYFCTQTLDCFPDTGTLHVVFEGICPDVIEKGMKKRTIFPHRDGDTFYFYLQERHQFEDIDHLWGLVYPLLVP